MKNQLGLTLIELLIALSISALIAIGTLSLFNSSVITRDTLLAQSEEMSQLSRSIRVIEQDFIQLAPSRPVRDAFGVESPAIHQDFDGLSLTHNGWAFSPFMTYERSTLQRVMYRLEEPGSDLCTWLEEEKLNELGGCLVRSYQAHLDDDGSLVWYHQMLFRPVKKLDWRFLIYDPSSKQSEFANELPSVDPSTGTQVTRLLGAEVSLEAGNGSIHKRLFAVPSLPTQ